MTTDELIRDLRDRAAVVGVCSLGMLLKEAADRLEYLKEKLDIVNVTLIEMDERLGEMRL